MGIAKACQMSSKWIVLRTRSIRYVPPQGIHGHWKIPALMLVSALLVASCVGSGPMIDSGDLMLASASGGGTQTTATVGQKETQFPPTGDPSPATEGSNAPDLTAVRTAAPGSAADRVSSRGTSPGWQSISLRPKNNVDADDLLDHWGQRHNGLVSARLSDASEPDDDAADFEDLLEAARSVGTESAVPDLQDDDTITVLGHRHGVTYGRWSGGPADTLSIEFDLQDGTNEITNYRSFKAALERAGKAWSVRIDDTWQAWERSWNESKGRLIGNYSTNGGKFLSGREERPVPAL